MNKLVCKYTKFCAVWVVCKMKILGQFDMKNYWYNLLCDLLIFYRLEVSGRFDIKKLLMKS